MTNFDVSYTGTYIESAAVLLSSSRFGRWGSSQNRPKKWSFNSQYELMGLFGTSTKTGIGSLGIIVFKAAQCRNSFVEGDEIGQETDNGQTVSVASSSSGNTISSNDSSTALDAMAPKTEEEKSNYMILVYIHLTTKLFLSH